GVTGLSIGERHLTRGVDYSIDAVQGRILLARPLWSFERGAQLGAAPATAFAAPVLWVDYERPTTAVPSQVMGAELTGRLGPVTLSIAAGDEASARLLRASASA